MPQLPSTSERLTQQFYAWEMRGRGWMVWPAPVELEPPFRPFVGHYVTPGPAVDDARKQSALGGLVDSFRKFLDPASVAPPPIEQLTDEEEESEPEQVVASDSLIELALTTPVDDELSHEVFEQFLLSVSTPRDALAFELIGTPDAITTQLVTGAGNRAQVQRQLQAHFPNVVVTPHAEFLCEQWGANDAAEVAVVEFGLARECMLPLGTFHKLPVDPLVGIVAALEELRDGELGLFQVLFQPTRFPWTESLLRAVMDNEGGFILYERPRTLLRREGESGTAALRGGGPRRNKERNIRPGLGDCQKPCGCLGRLRKSARERTHPAHE